MAPKANFEFNFAVPSDRTLAIARDLLDAPEPDTRTVAKALLDATEVAIETRDRIMQGSCDLAPYFDHWFADSLEAAAREKDSSDPDRRTIATTLMEQAKATFDSKEAFLKETKRLNVKPHRDMT